MKNVNVQDASQDLKTIAVSGPANYANRFVISLTPAGPRITFAEQSEAGQPSLFRSAVLITQEDAKALIAALQKILT